MKFKLNCLKLILLIFICLPMIATESSAEQKDYFISNILKGDVNSVIEHLDMYPKDIDYKNESRETTLMLAIKSNFLPMFITIINKTLPKKINETSNSGDNAFRYVFNKKISKTNTYLFGKFLLEKGRNINGEELILACYYGYFDLVKLLLNNKYCKDNINLTSIDKGRTAFFWSIMSENTINKKEIVKYLLKNGADINKLDNENMSPLFAAIKLGDLNLVSFLIDNGADINYVIPSYEVYGKNNALCYAINLREEYKENFEKSSNLYEIIKLLISKNIFFKKKFTINRFDDLIKSSLHIAITHADYDVVKLMVSKGADTSEIVNRKNLFKISEEKYRNENDIQKKESYRKIHELLKNPTNQLMYENNELIDFAIAFHAPRYLYKEHKLPRDITDIVVSYLQGPIIEEEILQNNLLIAFNQLTEIIENKDDQGLIKLLDDKVGILFERDHYNGSGLTYSIKNEYLFGIITILQKFKELRFNTLKKINAIETKESIIAEHMQQLTKLKEFNENIDVILKAQLKESQIIANKIGNQQIINILNSYIKILI